MQDDLIKLVAETVTESDEGFPRYNYTEKEIFADVKTVSSAEFFRAGEDGHRAQYKVVIYADEYSGESIVEINGKRYYVYRTYQSMQDFLELYVEQKVGINEQI